MFRVRDFQGFAFGVQISIFGVFGVSRWVVGTARSGFGFFKVRGFEFGVSSSGFRVRISGFWFSRFGIFEFGVSRFGFLVSMFRVRVRCFAFGV